MRLAAVDFGTNSTRLLIADITYHNGKVSLTPVLSLAKVSQLGKTLHSDNMIPDEPVKTTLEIITFFKSKISELKPIKTYALATSVFREAKNGTGVKTMLENALGTEITTISGEKEAGLMFKGISVNRHIDPQKRYLCIDLGGGSTELIIAKGNNIEKAFSLPIGCLRTKNMFLKTDPPSNNEISDFKYHIINNLREIENLRMECDTFFAFGGTITSLAKIISGKQPKNIFELENLSIRDVNIECFYQAIKNLSDKEIGSQYNDYLDQNRETVIRAGTIILLTLMKYIGQNILTLSNQGILCGLLSENFSLINNIVKQ